MPTTSTPLPTSIDAELASVIGMSSLLEGRKILYIDDNLAARSSTAALLVSLGMAVDTAEDGPRGLAMFREQAYDAVITDMSMPGMNGLQLTTEFKLLQPTMPVVLISGWSVTDSHHQTQNAKPDGVLSKPVSASQLAATLVQVLQAA